VVVCPKENDAARAVMIIDEKKVLIDIKLLEKCGIYLRIIPNKGKGRKNG
jgi:hypothetical protein